MAVRNSGGALPCSPETAIVPKTMPAAIDDSLGRSAVVSGSPTPAEWTPPPKSSFLIIVDRLDAFFRIVLHAIDFATNRMRLHQAFIVGP